MKVYIWKDEAYPVYGIDTDLKRHQNKSVELPDELYQSYLKVGKEYKRVQDELKKYSCE